MSSGGLYFAVGGGGGAGGGGVCASNSTGNTSTGGSDALSHSVTSNTQNDKNLPAAPSDASAASAAAATVNLSEQCAVLALENSALDNDGAASSDATASDAAAVGVATSAFVDRKDSPVIAKNLRFPSSFSSQISSSDTLTQEPYTFVPRQQFQSGCINQPGSLLCFQVIPSRRNYNAAISRSTRARS